MRGFGQKGQASAFQKEVDGRKEGAGEDPAPNCDEGAREVMAQRSRERKRPLEVLLELRNHSP